MDSDGRELDCQCASQSFQGPTNTDGHHPSFADASQSPSSEPAVRISLFDQMNLLVIIVVGKYRTVNEQSLYRPDWKIEKPRPRLHR